MNFKKLGLLFIFALQAIILSAQSDCGINLPPIKVWSKSQASVIYKIDPTIPNSYISVIDVAASNWNNNSNRNWSKLNKQFTSSSQPSSPTENGTNSISFGYPSNSSALAVTKTFPQYGAAQIREGDIMINYNMYLYDQFYTGYSSVNIVPSNKYDLLTVMVHELGHFLGLGHAETSNCTNQIMYYNIPSGKRRYIQNYESTVLRNFIISDG